MYSIYTSFAFVELQVLWKKLLWFLLLQVGKLLDSKGYGIAFTPGSLYRVPISSAILQLQVGISTLLLD